MTGAALILPPLGLALLSIAAVLVIGMGLTRRLQRWQRAIDAEIAALDAPLPPDRNMTDAERATAMIANRRARMIGAGLMREREK